MKADLKSYKWELSLIHSFSGSSEASWQKLWSVLGLFSALPKPSLFFNSLSSLFNFVRIAVFIWLQSTPNLAATWSAKRHYQKASWIMTPQLVIRCWTKTSFVLLTDYTSQDVWRELRLVTILSCEGVPPALKRVCGQCFSVKKDHQQGWSVLLVVCNLCNPLIKIFWYSKILSEKQEVEVILRAKNKS